MAVASPAPLTKSRMVRVEKWRFKQFTLKAGETAFKGGLACIKQSDGKAYAGVSGSGYVAIGLFAEDKTSDADTTVNVDLLEEKNLVWLDNPSSSTDAVAATDFGKVCYFNDDRSVTMTGTSRSIAGVVWGIDSNRGALVELGKGVAAAAA